MFDQFESASRTLAKGYREERMAGIVMCRLIFFLFWIISFLGAHLILSLINLI